MPKKNLGGRPTLKTEAVVAKLEYILERDWTVDQACRYAWISRDAFYDRKKADKSFCDRMERAEDNMFVMALEGLHENLKKKDKFAIESFLKRRDRRYKDKVEEDRDETINLIIRRYDDWQTEKE